MPAFTPASRRSLTRLGTFLTVLGAGLPMGLALATGLFAPWLEEHGATVRSIATEWSALLVLSGVLVATGVSLVLGAQSLTTPNTRRA